MLQRIEMDEHVRLTDQLAKEVGPAAGVQQQQLENRPLGAGRQSADRAVDDQLERTKDAELHNASRSRVTYRSHLVGLALALTVGGVGLEAGRALPDDDNDAGIVAVTDAAFRLALDRRFTAASSVHDITLSVTCIAMRYGRDRVPPVRDMEAVVRSELGESMPVADIDPQTVQVVKILVFERIVDELGLLTEELDALLAEAESVAIASGATPTPAP